VLAISLLLLIILSYLHLGAGVGGGADINAIPVAIVLSPLLYLLPPLCALFSGISIKRTIQYRQYIDMRKSIILHVLNSLIIAGFAYLVLFEGYGETFLGLIRWLPSMPHFVIEQTKQELHDIDKPPLE
jgi:hypothetical protein